jgi:hypothetical protein
MIFVVEMTRRVISPLGSNDAHRAERAAPGRCRINDLHRRDDPAGHLYIDATMNADEHALEQRYRLNLQSLISQEPIL